MQNHYNLLYREEEREMIPLCLSEGVGIIPWSPLARGILAGTRSSVKDKEATERSKTDAFTQVLYRESDMQIVERVKEVAKERDVQPAQIALAWLLNKPGVTAPIIGATKMEHLDAAIDSVNIKLTGDEMKKLEELYEPHPPSGMFS